jgi:hypothetical protein
MLTYITFFIEQNLAKLKIDLMMRQEPDGGGNQTQQRRNAFRSFYSTVDSCVSTQIDQCMDPMDELFLKFSQQEESVGETALGSPTSISYSNIGIIQQAFASSPHKCKLALALFEFIEEEGEKGVELESIYVSENEKWYKYWERNTHIFLSIGQIP